MNNRLEFTANELTCEVMTQHGASGNGGDSSSRRI